MAPRYGWGPRGQRVIGRVPGGHRHHHTLVGTLTPQGMGPTLVLEGAIDRAGIDAFLAQMVLPLLGPGMVVIMDNASIHHGTRTRSLIEATGAQLRFLPPYSPEFNPIEQAWAKLKGQVSKRQPRTYDALMAAIKDGVAAITEQDARGFYRHAGYPLPGQLLCEPL
jgi:transposase